MFDCRVGAADGVALLTMFDCRVDAADGMLTMFDCRVGAADGVGSGWGGGFAVGGGSRPGMRGVVPSSTSISKALISQ